MLEATSAESGASDARRLGRYRLVAEIARGGMGVIYLAQMTGPAGFQKFVVVKELKSELVTDDNFREMFLDEARLAARLHHRNIVQTNEVGSEDGRYFMVMEYLDGRSLHAVQSKFKGEQLPLAISLRVVSEMLSGLHYAHELTDYDGTPLGIVHRDVSTQNTFITYDGQVKLVDFGVAKAQSNTLETQVGVMKGRVVCMAPEHVANSAAVDRRADIFSAGVLLREMVTGKRVWDGMPEIDVMRKLLAKELPALPGDLPVFAKLPALRAVIERAMAVEPADRFETAAQMRAALDPIIAALDPTATETLGKLGDLLSTSFAAKRDAFRQVIEKHIARAEVEASSVVPLVPMSDPFLENSGTSKPSAPRSGTRSSTLDSRAGIPSIAGASEQTSASQSSQVGMPPPRSGRTGLVAGVAIGLALAAAGAIGFGFRRASPPPAPAAANEPPPAVVVTQAPADGAGDLAELTVKGFPANAQIFVDDAAMPENPWRAKYKRGSSHVIRVVAPGYAPRTEQVALSEASTVSITLDRQSATPAVAIVPAARRPAAVATPSVVAPASAPAPTPTPTPDISPTGGKAPKRTIEQKNPYE